MRGRANLSELRDPSSGRHPPTTFSRKGRRKRERSGHA
jgi:hypothetical protein